MFTKTPAIERNLIRITRQLGERGIEVTPVQLERAIDSDSNGNDEIAAAMVLDLAHDEQTLDRFAMTFANREKTRIIYCDRVVYMDPDERRLLVFVLLALLAGGLLGSGLISLFHVIWP